MKVKYLNEALILGENENGFRANPYLPLSGTVRALHYLKQAG
ncbi:hypothetical protein [Bacillus sp. hwrm1]